MLCSQRKLTVASRHSLYRKKTGRFYKYTLLVNTGYEMNGKAGEIRAMGRY